MRLNEIDFEDATPIDGYGPGFFRIGGEVFQSSVLTHVGGVVQWGGYDDLETILDLRDALDVVFVGTGAEIAHAPPAFRKALEDAGIGVEVMASPTACRSYNVLLSEGRRVAAALLPV